MLVKKVHGAIFMHSGASMLFNVVLTGICVTATWSERVPVASAGAICVAVIMWLLFTLAVLMFGHVKEWPVRW